MNRPRSAKIGTIWPGGSAADSGVTSSQSDGNVRTPDISNQDATIASNSPRDNDAPVLRRRNNSGQENTSTQTEQSPAPNSASNPNNSANQTITDPANPGLPPAQWNFSARDRRVINTCLSDNPGSVPARSGNAIPYHRGDTLPYAAQKQIRSLPLACERQLPPVASDNERIIYNQQVLLIDSNSLVLDSFDLNMPQQP